MTFPTLFPTDLSNKSRSRIASVSIKLTLCLASTLLLSSCGSEPLPVGQAEFADAMENLRSGDISAADEMFGAAADADPARPWRALGAARKIEVFSYAFGALKQYESIVRLSPDFDSGYTAFCRLALAYGKADLAKLMARQYASQLGVNYAPEEDAGQTVVSSSIRAFHLIAGQIEIELGEYENSESRLRSLLSSFGDDGEIRFALASALLAQDRVDEALEQAADANEHSDNSRAVSMAGVGFYIEANRAKSAIDLLENLKKDYADDIQIDRFIFESYLKLGYLDFADSKITSVAASGVPENVLWLMRAQLSQSVGEFRRAYNLYLYAHSLEKTNHELYRVAAQAIARANNFIMAEDNMKNALIYIDDGKNSEEYVADAYLDMAELYSWTRQWKRCLSNIDKAQAVFGETGRLEFMRIHALTFLLAEDSARGFLQTLTAKNNALPVWNLGIAGSFTDLKELDSADIYLDKVLSRFPKNLPALLSKVKLAQLAQDTVSYRRAVDQLLEFHPRDQRALKLAIAHSGSVGGFSRALDLSERLIAYFPGNLSAYQLSNRIVSRSDGVGAGRKYLLQAIENNPGLPAALHVLSIDFLHSGETDSVATYVLKALEMDPGYIPSLLSLGLLYENRNQTDSAIALYRKVIERDPFSGEAFNNLAWAIAEADMDPRQAANYAREAIGLSGGRVAKMHTTLGWSYHKQGRYDAASISFRQSVNLDPNGPLKHCLMGINYEKWDQSENAIRELKTALEQGIRGKYLKLTEEALLRLKG